MRCALAPEAIGDHEHSATLGSGSARKNYLMGYGRGYVLRKWRVLTARRLPGVLVRESILCAGQAVVDRNVAGVRGRLRGYRAPAEIERYPSGARARAGARAHSRPCAGAPGAAPGCVRAPPPTPAMRTLAVFHLADTSGPSRSLEAELVVAGRAGIPGRRPSRARQRRRRSSATPPV